MPKKKPFKIGDPPPPEPLTRTAEMDVSSMTSMQLLEKVRVAVGHFSMSICEQKSWTEEDIEQLGRCSRILVSLARLEANPAGGPIKGVGSMTDEELEATQ